MLYLLLGQRNLQGRKAILLKVRQETGLPQLDAPTQAEVALSRSEASATNHWEPGCQWLCAVDSALGDRSFRRNAANRETLTRTRGASGPAVPEGGGLTS